MAEEKRKPFEAVAPESAGTIRIPFTSGDNSAIPARVPSSYANMLPPEARALADKPTTASLPTWLYNPDYSPSGEPPKPAAKGGAHPDDADRLAKKHPAPSKAAPATKPTPAAAPAKPAPAAPAPSADPAQAAMDSALQDFTSSSPASRFDDDLMLSRIMMDGMAAAGLTDKYNQWKGVYADALTKRYKDVSDGAIRAAVAGDFGPAMAAYNHLVPNGVTITGYAQQPDGGLHLRFSDGRSQVMNSNQLMGMLTALSEPSKVLAMYDEIGKIGAQTQGKMAEQQQKAQLDMLLEQYKQQAGAQREQTLALMNHKLRVSDPSFHSLQKTDDGRLIKVYKDGRTEELVLGGPGVIEGTTTESRTVPIAGAPQAGAAAPISKDNPGWR